VQAALNQLAIPRVALSFALLPSNRRAARMAVSILPSTPLRSLQSTGLHAASCANTCEFHDHSRLGRGAKSFHDEHKTLPYQAMIRTRRFGTVVSSPWVGGAHLSNPGSGHAPMGGAPADCGAGLRLPRSPQLQRVPLRFEVARCRIHFNDGQHENALVICSSSPTWVGEGTW
jgi:hypothetical protein